MGETADQIRIRIEQARSRLGEDLNTLEYSVQEETSWRVYLSRNPWAFVGAVCGLVLLAGLVFGSRRS
jgi:ElaB/YqjD/DUF883 family membrane-anchored ribosome-binding protein